MSNLNKTFLMGHLCRDPELRYLPKGTPVCQCSLATNRKWKAEDGSDREEILFIDFTAWGKTGETISQYLKKGSPIFIEGRLKLDQWDDKQSGAKRSKISVVVESFQFIGGKDKGEVPTGRVKQAAAAPSPSDNDGGSAVEGDDVPF